MNEQWYCSIRGKQTGPLSAQQLKTIAAKGHLSPDDLVRAGVAGAWVPAKRIKGLFTAAGHPSHDGGPSPATADAEVRRPPATRAPENEDLAEVPVVPLAPPPQVTPPPVANDLTFLEHPTPLGHEPTHGRGGRAGANEVDENRRRQLLVVGVLLAAFVVVTAMVVAAYISANRPEMPPEQVAVRPPAESPKAGGGGPSANGEGQKASQPSRGKPAGTEDRKAKQAITEADEGKWVDARSASATFGDIQVKLRSATIGIPEGWTSTSPTAKPRPFLILAIELANTSKSRKIDHSGWAVRTPSAMGIKLTDEVPNNYAVKGAAVGLTGPSSIYPEESIEDKLIFERPIDAAKVLRLQLPASVFGGKGTIRFEIPREMIVVAAEQPKPKEGVDSAKAQAKVESKPKSAPVSGRVDDTPERTGDPMVDFGIDEKMDQRPPGAKVPGTRDGAGKRSDEGPAKKAGKAAEGGLKAVDEGPANKGTGFDKANRQKSPF